MSIQALADTSDVCRIDIMAERQRQLDKWGVQHHPDGTERTRYTTRAAVFAKRVTDLAADAGELTWQDIFYEEVAEALCEVVPARLRAELIQVATVAIAWVVDIDDRAAQARAHEPIPYSLTGKT